RNYAGAGSPSLGVSLVSGRPHTASDRAFGRGGRRFSEARPQGARQRNLASKVSQTSVAFSGSCGGRRETASAGSMEGARDHLRISLRVFARRFANHPRNAAGDQRRWKTHPGPEKGTRDARQGGYFK